MFAVFEVSLLEKKTLTQLKKKSQKRLLAVNHTHKGTRDYNTKLRKKKLADIMATKRDLGVTDPCVYQRDSEGKVFEFSAINNSFALMGC